jgi:hypothetical protein
MKKFAIWFGLQDVGILYSRAEIQRTTDVSPSLFGARFGRKYRGLSTCKQAGGWIYFCMKQLRTLNSYKIFKIKNKK